MTDVMTTSGTLPARARPSPPARVQKRRAPEQAAPRDLMRAPAPDQLRVRLRLRHWLVILSFVFCAVLPAALSVWYLAARAADRYVSRVAFTVFADSFVPSTGMFNDLLTFETGEATDTDILYAFLVSPDMAQRLDRRLDLRAMYAKAADRDPWFSLPAGASDEALQAYLRWRIDVTYEVRQGVINLAVEAFDPADAQTIAEAVRDEAAALVDRLSEAARADKVRFAVADVAEARARLDAERARLRAFRNENRIVSPEADVTGQTGLLRALQADLADTVVRRAQLAETARDGDARLAQAERRIRAINAQIAAERKRLGDGEDGASIVRVLGAYEALLVDVEFAQDAYVSAQEALEVARAEANRRNRYLAVHVAPTRPEAPVRPERLTLSLAVPFFLFAAWLMAALIGYNIRDSRTSA